MTRRRTFIIRFHQHAKPYHVDTVHVNQASIIAGKLAAKYGWTIATIGVAIR